MSTKFHTVKMRIRTKCHNFDLDPGTKEVVAEISPESTQPEVKTLALDSKALSRGGLFIYRL